MAFPAPADAPVSDIVPVSDTGVSILPPIVEAPSPENDEITPPPTPSITLPISTPLLPPLVAPTQPPIVVVGDTPPPLAIPTLSPISQPPPSLQQPQPPLQQSQPQPLLQPQPPQPQPLLQPQPPLNLPPPITKNNPPLKKTNPPKNNSPINTNSPPPISNDPIIPTTPPLPPSSSTRPEIRPITQPNPSHPPISSDPIITRPVIQPSPSRPKTLPKTSKKPPTKLPTSAELPASSPPVALPVPQSPTGGAWVPLSAEPPSPLPILPAPAGTLSSPTTPLHGSTITSSSSLSGDHQNIQANVSAPKGSNNGAGFVVGLAVCGVLLLFFGAVFGILVVLCKRRDKKKVGDNESGRKNATFYSKFEDKTSLPHYTKQGSNTTLGHHPMINDLSTPKGPNMDTNGTPLVGPTLGSGPSFSSGSFTYEELSRATNAFSEQNLLGEGGFGYVHKGILANGKEIAVKKLKIGGHQGEREFRAEVQTISQVHHKHLVCLVGYCISGAERLLVYEFVPNNTLEFHLHGIGQPVMDWPTRLKIASGAAKGFAYLHEDCSPTIIHRDIKAANILLDYNFEAKVSDFGLAKIFSSTNPSATHITTRVVGTFGYLAPEYASSGKVTDKSDVYSYGVMLLELITGRPPISNCESSSGSLVNWARPFLAQAIGDGKFDSLADPKLQNDYNVDEMTSMVACAAACVRLSAWRRPRMSQVVRALEGSLAPSELDDGTRPGQSAMNFPYESLDFDARNYMEDLKRLALTGNIGHTSTSRYRENPDISEYGLNFSPSSTDTRHPSNSRG